ncbi:MAG: hypothetical protein JNK60_18260 [Acidobacteria bacterium]|nr:hypothetical protein [Acidobacteriota bacterium]
MSLALTAAGLPAAIAAEEEPKIPSLVGLSGRVTVKGLEGQEIEVTNGRLVAPGTTIEVHPGGRARLIYGNGSRFDLKPGTKLVLGNQPPKASETIVPLEGTSSALVLQPIVKSPAVTSGQAVVRLRGKRIDGFETTVFGDTVTVTFNPVRDGAHYRVEVEAKGAVLFRQVVSEPRIVIPRAALGEARAFNADELRCVVRTHDAAGDLLEGSVPFPWGPEASPRP